MKIDNSSILLIILIVAVLAVSGCTGGGSASPSPTTHTGVPDAGAQTPTTTPTQSPGGPGTGTSAPAGSGELTTVGQLFDPGLMHAYQFRITQVANGVTTTGTCGVSYTDEVYQGVPAKHLVMSLDAAAAGQGSGQMVVDVYTSAADNRTLGGHMSMTSNGQKIIDMDIPADQASTYYSNDYASSGEANSGLTLTAVGTDPDPIVVNGKSYTCTKYTYVEEGITYTVWYNPQVPVPVKETYTDNNGALNTIELLSWS